MLPGHRVRPPPATPGNQVPVGRQQTNPPNQVLPGMHQRQCRLLPRQNRPGHHQSAKRALFRVRLKRLTGRRPIRPVSRPGQGQVNQRHRPGHPPIKPTLDKIGPLLLKLHKHHLHRPSLRLTRKPHQVDPAMLPPIGHRLLSRQPRYQLRPLRPLLFHPTTARPARLPNRADCSRLTTASSTESLPTTWA